ncbi:MAG: hypothetical protein ACETWE_08485 [Candidatus Bathyarchaeia archaeon]
MERRFRIDLMEIEGDGEFLCPTCGAKISPDDYSGITYSILDIKTEEDGTLEEVKVQCRGCQSIICLHGFALLEDIPPDQRFGYNSEKPLNINLRNDTLSAQERPNAMRRAITE